MSKHTPGPWATYVNTWPDRILVRSMFDDGTERALVAITNAQNASLIAAAPDMLAALQGMLDCCYDLERNDETLAAVKAAMKAIAKATGEDN